MEAIKEEYLKEIDPGIKKLRQILFNSEKPFRSKRAAVQWLKENYKNELGEPHGILILKSLKETIIPQKGSKLDILAQFCEWVAERSGFDRDSLAEYIFFGKKPEFKIFKITSPFPSDCLCFSFPPIKIEIFAPLIKDDFKILSKEIRKQVKGRPCSSEKLWKLYDFVKRLGGPPKKNVREFWREAQKKWNKIYPDESYGTPEGLRMGFKLISKKLVKIETDGLGEIPRPGYWKILERF